MSGDTDATQIFLDHRELMFSVVYHLLGSVADTEDVLQETWLSWAAAGRAEVGNPRAYLVRIAVNAALARQASVRRRRETYVGPWLPEPIRTGFDGLAGAADPALRAEAVSIALLVVLETLTPLERAVFVLHEVFGYSHTDCAGLLGRSPVAVRQLAHRARVRVRTRHPRREVHPRLRRQVTERFVAAAAGGDIRALLDLLAPDVTLIADGGGKAPAAGRYPVHGRQRVARALAAGTGRFPRGLAARYRQVNGAVAAVLVAEGRPFAVLTLDLDPSDERVGGVYLVSNPDKLTHLEDACFPPLSPLRS